MRFSEKFGIRVDRHEDWFDPILTIDTRLFIDPFLIYDNEFGLFRGSHKEIIDFFNSIFQIVARSRGDKSSVLWKKAESSLYFPEVEEVCLGYTSEGTRGAGSGRGLANIITRALYEAIRAGVREITHFEEIGILREGIGADRISDITGNLLRWRLAAYTEEVCKKHKVPTVVKRYFRGAYDVDNARWAPFETRLPINPYNKKPILLVPRKYLRDLPTIDAYGFWEYCFYNENDIIRNEFNYDVVKNVDKETIIEFARKHPELRGRYLRYVEDNPSKPYDLSEDASGLYRWYAETFNYAAKNPIVLSLTTIYDLNKFLENLIGIFKNYVENNRGLELLWNDNKTQRRESASQNLFLGIVKHYCHANDIDISREPNIGRGAVDFKASKGSVLRALLEVKLASNTKFWNGLEKQLPKYMQSEDVNIGYMIVIAYNEADFERITGIEERVRKMRGAIGLDVKTVIIDARRNPPSASRL